MTRVSDGRTLRGVDRPYVEWVRIEGYRCIKSADLHLTPLHALIGPNDSGKSSILRAIETKHVRAWVRNVGATGYGEWSNLPYPVWRNTGLEASARGVIGRATEPVRILRLDPDAMRLPSNLFAGGEVLWFRDEKGTGLAGLFDALLSRDLSAFSSINDAFKTLFPTVRSLRLHNPNQMQKQLGLTLADGSEVGPTEMSEGMLYWLAFAVIEYLAPQAIILIEEPENGLHPARIREVMKVLREVSKRTQIILATHSPLVINELAPEEVTIVTRTPERGTICTSMARTKNFEQRSKIYALGELWLSYADGDLESALMPEAAEDLPKAG